jgi:hypothetical protein
VLQAVEFNKRSGFWTRPRGTPGCERGGGEAGEDGAVLEFDEVLLEDTLGVVVDELPELTVELESDVTKT